jgi:Ca2+-binding RTX toxin-like protein
MAVTQFEIDNALMAGRAYFDTRASINRFPVPQGWVEFNHRALDSGFEATSFTDGSRIVISYAGTDFTDISDWTQANIPLAFGFGSDQLRQAALYYLEVKTANPTATISFTGHSLGGDLAALMAVLFDEQAITFDQAPFANSATLSIREDLIDYLKDNGYTDATLSSLVPELLTFNPYDPAPGREANITGYYVDGEVLAELQANTSLRILGSQTKLSQNSTGLGLDGPVSLHAQSLLTAFLENDAFRAITFSLPELLKMVFDEALYYRDPNNTDNPERNLLEHLLRHQIGVAADPSTSTAAIPTDAMLDRFTADLQKVAQAGGFTLSNQHIANTLVAFAMQFYYENTDAAVIGHTLYADVTGGLRFDRSDVSASLADAKGWQQYFQNWLAQDLSLEEHRIVLQLLPAATDWFIQSGLLDLNATADISKAFMVGGTGNDWMRGGSQADLLIGNAGDDTLNGGAGNDTLMGGAGDDTYVIDAGDGFDTIVDTDGSGSIVLDGLTLTGGALVAGTTNVWKDAAHGLTYTLQGTGASQVLLISKDGSSDGLRIQGWQAGQLGLAMSGTIAPPATTTISGTDGYSDGLTGTGGSDQILGLSGNDALDGGAGDDILEGGLGDDLLAGGAGSDTIYGGAGRDMILSATGLNLQPQRDRNNDGVLDDWAPPAGAGAVWTSGRLWGIYASATRADVYVVEGGGSLNQDSAGDIVFAGDDDDRVVGGLGDDYIDGGAERHDSAPNISIHLLRQLNTTKNQNLTRAYN